MSFNDIVDAIPIVGHVKGIVHYAIGDTEEGDRAMYAASRTTAVLAGGAAGIVGGPAGMIAGATGAGLLADSIATAASGKPQGIMEGVDGIVHDIEEGHVPVASVLKTGVFLGADALSGIGGGYIAGTVGRSAAKAATKAAAGELIAAEIARTAVAENTLSSSRSGHSGIVTTIDSDDGGGSQPPKKPNDPSKDDPQEPVESHMEAFLRIFGVSSLSDVTIRGVYIFRDLPPSNMTSLRKLIRLLRKNGCLIDAVQMAIVLFNDRPLDDVVFENFLSLAQFAAAYIGEQVAQRSQAQRGVSDQAGSSFAVRHEQNQEAVVADIREPGSDMVSTYAQLESQIRGFSITPDFRNMDCAIYHYYKHKIIPQCENELLVTDYYSIIQSLLDRVRTLAEYAELTDTSHSRRELVFDRVISWHGRLVRMRIVLKIQNGTLVLSSCYSVDDNTEYDQEGREFIDP